MPSLSEGLVAEPEINGTLDPRATCPAVAAAPEHPYYASQQYGAGAAQLYAPPPAHYAMAGAAPYGGASWAAGRRGAERLGAGRRGAVRGLPAARPRGLRAQDRAPPSRR